MIRINLLPVRATKKRELGKQWLVLFALIAVGVVIGNYMWWSDAQTELASVRSRIARYEKDIEQLEKIIGEVKNIKDAKAEMQRKLTILRELKAKRKGPVRMMDELATILPQRITITSLVDGGESISVTGYGTSHEEVALFMKKLKESPMFGVPSLKSARAAQENRVNFSITCPRRDT